MDKFVTNCCLRSETSMLAYEHAHVLSARSN